MQYANKNSKDCIVQTERDFEDFEIPFNIDYLNSKSESVFKTLVKKKAKVYQLKKLKSEQMIHSKTMNLQFDDLFPNHIF